MRKRNRSIILFIPIAVAMLLLALLSLTVCFTDLFSKAGEYFALFIWGSLPLIWIGISVFALILHRVFKPTGIPCRVIAITFVIPSLDIFSTLLLSLGAYLKADRLTSVLSSPALRQTFAVLQLLLCIPFWVSLLRKPSKGDNNFETR